jgi:hypothetical protein
MPEPSETQPPVIVTVQLHPRVAALLSVLIGPDTGLADLQGVLLEIVDHVQQGVYRPGSWERGWLEAALGSDWQARLEPEPGTPFERPAAPMPSGPPEWLHHAYGVALTLPDFEDEPVIGFLHNDPRRFIAACSRVAREVWGLYRLSDVTRPETAYAAVSHRWAAWERGEVYRDGNWTTGWVLDWDAAEDAPGAFPVTVMQPDPPHPQADASSAEGSDRA